MTLVAVPDCTSISHLGIFIKNSQEQLGKMPWDFQIYTPNVHMGFALNVTILDGEYLPYIGNTIMSC